MLVSLVVFLVGLISLIFLYKVYRSGYKANSKSKRPQKKTAAVRGDELEVWPFEPMPLMTNTEVLFFNKLQQAIPECYIFSQVQLSQVIEPNEETAKERSFWFNRICRQSLDYVLVDGDAQTVLLAIELDDWTHQNQTRQKADDKKDKALTSAGIPILRFHAERMPSVNILRQDILQVLDNYVFD